MLNIEKYECPKCHTIFTTTSGGFAGKISKPICPHCGYKLSFSEKIACSKLPTPDILLKIFKKKVRIF